MEARLSDSNGLFKELQVEARPRQVWNSQTANCVKDTHNLDKSRGFGSVMVRRTVPRRRNLRSSIGLFLGRHSIDPFQISLRLAEVQAIGVLLI